jgi:hypothetical protein
LDPIIWLFSPHWFEFLKRRVEELSNFQTRLSRFKHRPDNYGSLTAILTHMIQHVVVTPIVQEPHLRNFLTELRFDTISNKFGCFFLHNLNLTNGYLLEVSSKDPSGMLKGMGINSTTKPKGKVKTVEIPPSEDSLTWKELGILLNQQDDRAKVRDFEWDPLWAEYSAAENIFCQFTRDFWIAHTHEAFTPIPKGSPTTLERAMQFWTLKSVEERINKHERDIHLVPSPDKLHGNIPPKSKTQLFGLKRTAFFPDRTTNPIARSNWRSLFQVGYVKEYHRQILMSGDGGKVIKDSLDKIFENLQLLPHNPGQPGDVKPLWRRTGNAVNLLVNSSYIRLADRTLRFKVGTATAQRQGGKHLLRSKAEMELQLRQEHEREHPKKVKSVYKSIQKYAKQLAQGRKKGKLPSQPEPSAWQSELGSASDHWETVGAASVAHVDSVEMEGRTGKLADHNYPLTGRSGIVSGSHDQSGAHRGRSRRGRPKNYRNPPPRGPKIISELGTDRDIETFGAGRQGDKLDDYEAPRYAQAIWNRTTNLD